MFPRVPSCEQACMGRQGPRSHGRSSSKDRTFGLQSLQPWKRTCGTPSFGERGRSSAVQKYDYNVWRAFDGQTFQAHHVRRPKWARYKGSMRAPGLAACPPACTHRLRLDLRTLKPLSLVLNPVDSQTTLFPDVLSREGQSYPIDRHAFYRWPAWPGTIFAEVEASTNLPLRPPL